MDRKKLYEYLSRLNKREWIAFQEFLSHPMLGASELYVSFLKAFYPMRFEGKQLTEEDFQAVVYGNRDYDELHMNRHYTLMLDKLFDFLAYQTYRKDPSLRMEARIQALETRGWTEASDEVFSRGIKRLQKNPIRPVTDYLSIAKAAITKISLRPTPKPRKQKCFFQEAIDTLDQAYHVAALELASKAKNFDLHQDMHHQAPRWLVNFNGQTLSSPIPTILADAMQEILALYMPIATTEPHFVRAQQLLVQALEYLHPDNRLLFQELFNHLISHATRNLHVASALFRPALGKVYRAMLDHDLLLVDGLLSPLHLINVVDQVWKVESLEDALGNILALEGALPPKLREHARDTVIAMVYFHHAHFEQAILLLKNVTPPLGEAESNELILTSKTYLMMANLESKNYEALETMTQSFQKWLKRHQGNLGPRRLLRYTDFVDAVAKIANATIASSSVGDQSGWQEDLAGLRLLWQQRKPVQFIWLQRQMAGLLK